MIKKIVVTVVSGWWLGTLTPCYSQQLLETYQARLSERDHFNSAGQTAGPGCLNRISASISGVPAGVRPPRGTAAGRSKLDRG